MTHSWVPSSPCDESCVRDDPVDATGGLARLLRGTGRIALILLVLPMMPLTAIPQPLQYRGVRIYSRLLLRCAGVRITVSGNEIRERSGVMVVSPHISWIDVLAIWGVMPCLFVAKADMVKWPGIGQMARMLGVVPIDRTKLRPLPGIVAELAARMRSGQIVGSFPEGTSWCGVGHGRFRPAMFQAAIDAERPVLPLRLTFHHGDGRLSTVPAFVGDDTLLRSIWRVAATPQTIVNIHVGELQLPGRDRRELAKRCQDAIFGTVVVHANSHVAA